MHNPTRRAAVQLIRYATGDNVSIGALVDGGVVDLIGAGLPNDMVEFIGLGDEGLASAQRTIDAGTPIPLDEVTILAPIPRPPNNVMAVGRNYREHAQEFSDSGFDASEVKVIPDHPIIFTKAVSSIVGPGDAIDTANDPSGTTDYEGELAVVIGKRGRRISKDKAFEHVYGYTVVNDVTARETQWKHIQFFIGKSPDTYCPMGPNITTIDELPDIGSSWLRTVVNGELRQESPISMLIFDIPTLIATISESMTLSPGDVIATGTPVGVGIGLDPPTYLKAGDVVEVSIDGIGTLVNPVI